KQAHTQRLVTEGGSVIGVETALEVRFLAQCVVVTTGTFLRGLMHVGSNQQSGGRAGEPAAVGLSASLAELGFGVGRLKTGTPPGLVRQSIDFDRCEPQPGDDPVPYFSFWKDDLFHVEQSDSKYPSGSILERINGQLPCHITYTTDRTRELILANLSRSP